MRNARAKGIKNYMDKEVVEVHLLSLKGKASDFKGFKGEMGSGLRSQAGSAGDLQKQSKQLNGYQEITRNASDAHRKHLEMHNFMDAEAAGDLEARDKAADRYDAIKLEEQARDETHEMKRGE